MRARKWWAHALPAAILLAGCNGHLERKGEPPPPTPTVSSDTTSSSDEWSDDESGGAVAGESGDDATLDPQSEAARTDSMESQARALEKQYQDARANAKTPEEAERAYREFERKRAELNATGGQGGASGDAYGPPP